MRNRSALAIAIIASGISTIGATRQPNAPEPVDDQKPEISIGAIACAPVGAATGGGFGALIGSGIGIASGGTAMAGTVPLAQGGALIGGQAAILAAEALGLDCIDMAKAVADFADEGRSFTVEALFSALNWLERTVRRVLFRQPAPPLPSLAWSMGYSTEDWPPPTVHITATAAGLYRPPPSEFGKERVMTMITGIILGLLLSLVGIPSVRTRIVGWMRKPTGTTGTKA